MTAELPLTKGCVAIIDEADLPLVGRWKWSALVTSSTVYAKRNDRGRIVLLHRVLMGAEGWNARVDHRDGNGLNNCRSNLRLCTQAQNTANQRPQRNKSPEWSRFKGVEKRVQVSGRVRWIAYIHHGKAKHHLGMFDSEEDAARAYDAEALQRFGEFAHLNLKEGNGGQSKSA